MRRIAIIKSQKSTYYGEKEKQLLALLCAWQERGKEAAFFSGCRLMRNAAKEKGIDAKKIWIGYEPAGLKKSLIFTLYFIPLSIYCLLFAFKLKLSKKINSLYLVNANEKMLLTVPARIFGMNAIWEESAEVKNLNLLNPYRWMMATLSRFASVFAFSDAAKNNAAKNLLNGNVEIIYPGINLSELKNQETIFSAMAEQNAGSKNLFKIGTICHLSKQNGLEYLLQALKIVAELIPEAQLVIVGTGEERFNLSWLVRKLGLERHIWFMGYQDNYYYWLKSFDLFALPALKADGIHLAIIEAMAYFCPVIASNLPGINEIVKNNFSGILVDPANPEILAQSIIQLYRNKEKRQEMGQNGYNRVKAVFNIDRVLDDMDKLM